MNSAAFYFDQLYPLQDRVIRVLQPVDTGFYLTGGTAASRGYLHHRFSEDLDFFVNDDSRFGLWLSRCVEALRHTSNWTCTVLVNEPRFARLMLEADRVLLKLEWINDVPARVGATQDHPVLGRLDSAENILANKVTAALDRNEPKDLADIWGFCCQQQRSLPDAISYAGSKAAGVFPADIARRLCSVTASDHAAIRWINAPPLDTFLSQLNRLGESLLLSAD